MGLTKEVKNCPFSITKIVREIMKNPEAAKKQLPKQGFVTLGSLDENWGWLR
jgi:hypothetical protein